MKNLFLLLFAAIALSSCSEYQKVLSSEDTGKKYAMADSLYKQGKYKKALKLFEQVVPVYRGKPQAERLMYLYANTFYELEDYYLSGYQFERFETSYPQSDSVEVAAYKSAKSYYELSPRYSLDQEDTYKALEKLQNYINKYPNSEKRMEANELVAELRGKLEKKDIEIADQNLKIAEYIGDYRPAIESYDNFIADHPGSKYRKDAFYGRLQAAYQLAVRSIPSLVEERLLTAKEYYQKFIKYYSDTELKAEADRIAADIEERLGELQTETAQKS
ncbi:outer membrane protein assembly factor BamD [Marixanthomonas spongiae]|uniref:Outer membrane protein assembly factor BamD n=1 Tax=Marixanthomonas spongiae TaxID=2174845 RepID=A0A2U0I652_9FLAO|nr:outer membrane protein assembly factor BamD [Marixanthomonas spongiae]PVW16586.1 outer membrane protein assembly factor BamD [Marixanthomonas spongiae]